MAGWQNKEWEGWDWWYGYTVATVGKRDRPKFSFCRPKEKHIERLELLRVSCAGRNCSRRCFGFEEWENPIFCADSVPFCTSGVAWPTWMIASSFGLNFVLVVLVLVHLAVVRVRRDLPFASFGIPDRKSQQTDHSDLSPQILYEATTGGRVGCQRQKRPTNRNWGGWRQRKRNRERHRGREVKKKGRHNKEEEDPSESAEASEYVPKFDWNNTPVDYDVKEKKCKVKADIDVMSKELKSKIEEKGADQRDINAAEDGCGPKEYAEWSRCSKVAFYGHDGYNAAKKYGIEQTEPPTKNFNDMDEFDAYGFMHGTVLLLFDGCAVCNDNKVPNVTLSLLQHMPAGLLVDTCKEYVKRSEKALVVQMEMVKNQQKSKGTFAYGVALMERLCSEKKPDTDSAEQYYMQKLESSHYIWLPEIDVFNNETVVGRVMQIRQLHLDFKGMDESVDMTLKLSGSDFDKSGQFVKATLIRFKDEPAVPPSALLEARCPALHEAGHAAAARFNRHGPRVRLITIVPNKNEGRTDLEFFMGSFIAEAVFCDFLSLDDIESDLVRAENAACLLITHFENKPDTELTIKWQECESTDEIKAKSAELIIETLCKMRPYFDDEENKKIINEVSI
ncbi:hypothetical protein niasHT_010556 [Heterodera trifolii]|uniref:Uncharacterized protein n=1 Tax=Heterodera trifolii TaxID=157864 RepID=A0ABD2L246_9BILA